MKTVNRHLTRIFAIVLSAIMLVSNAGVIKAKAADGLFSAVNPNDTLIYIEPGKTVHASVKVRLWGSAVVAHRVMAKASTPLLTVSNIKFSNSEGYEKNLESDNVFQATQIYLMEFDLTAEETIKIGTNTISFVGYGYEFSSGEFTDGDIELITFSTYTPRELNGPEIIVSGVEYTNDLTPGSKLTMKVTLKNVGDIAALSNYVTFSFGDDIVPDYSVNKIKVGNIPAGGVTYAEIPVHILTTAKAGLQTVNVTIAGKTRDGEVISFSQSIYLTIPATDKGSATLKVTTEDNYKEIKPESEDNIKLKLENTGSMSVFDIDIAVASGFSATDGITKNYTTDSIASAKLKSGKSRTVEVPFVVAKNATAGLHEITLKVSYHDANGGEFSENITVYLFVPSTKGNADGDVKNVINIKNVSQTPAEPKAGEKVTISFDIINNGNADVTNFKVAGANLSSNGFEPLTNDPYVSVGTIAAGASKHVNVSFKCGKNIAEGMNTLGLSFTYTDANDEQQTLSENVYVLNVIGIGSDVGRPKLIVSDYGTDSDMLRAGESFNFNFTLKNTHTSKDAKNIKITLTQADGVFEPSQGTNIFYLEEIKPGETATLDINLKTRPDAVTGDYPILLRVEYEYDDMSEADKEKGGVSEENTIKLRAIENYRPVIENIAIDSWAGVNAYEAVDLNFEFYNMGKSTLGNVFVTIDGDFTLANNSNMSYVGAVQGYSSEYVTISVVPQIGGDASGTLTVHFEDSNGDEVTISQDFTQYVNDNSGADPGFDPGFDPGIDPGFDPNLDPNEDPTGETGKKILGLPVWLFIIICVVVVAGIATGTVFIIKKKKNKVKDIDDEDY